MSRDKSSEQKIVEVLQILSDRNDFPKFIIDVGANTNASISAPFIEQGWGGLLIEPQIYCANILKNRYFDLKNVEVVVCGCSDVSKSALLFHGKDGVGSELATLSTVNDPWTITVRNDDDTEKVELRTLCEIISDRKDSINDIGILKVDTESWDYYVLSGMNFEIHKPRVVVTEEYLWDVDLEVKKHRLLEDAGYVNIGWIEYNTVWIRSDYFCITWSNLVLNPWLSRVNKSSLPFAMGNYFEDIGNLTFKSNAYDGILQYIEVAGCIQREIRCSVCNVIRVPVALMNLSKRNIPCLPNKNNNEQLFISYHWQNKDGQLMEWDGLRTSLSSDIRSGGAVVENIDVLVPQEAGVYQLLIDLVVEHVGWLSKSQGVLCKSEVYVN